MATQSSGTHRGRKTTVEKAIGIGRKTKEEVANTPRRLTEEPSPLDNMSASEKKVWDSLKRVLKARGQWSRDNELAVHGLVIAAAELLDYRAVLLKEGRTYKVLSTAATRSLRVGELQEIDWAPEHYLTKMRPEVALMNSADRRMRAWLCEFGLTDATRGRIQLDRTKDDDEVLSQYGLN
jgi:hypothetical protein